MDNTDFHFVGGRRRFNAARQRAQAVRRHQVAALLSDGLSQSAIARSLNVHRSTICRDARAIGSFIFHEKCRYCKRWYSDFLGRASPQCYAVGRPKRRRRSLFTW